jgi:hypothetical protein
LDDKKGAPLVKPLNEHQTWVNVALFENPADSRAVESFLEQKRIEARTYNDKVLQLLLFLCPPRLTYRLQVRRGSFKVATDLLTVNPPGPLAKAIHCPSCGSLRVNYPQMTRKFLTPTILLHLAIIFRIIDHQCYCEACHLMWSLPKNEPVAEAAKPETSSYDHR